MHCHVSDGQDTDRPDFREIVEEVLDRFDKVTFGYLDALPPTKGYDFLLCAHCQTVRSTPFAIYRITSQTPAETFIAIGMSLALEAQFDHKIPRILLTANPHDIPSLLSGYEVVVAHNDQERKTSLRKFVPMVIQQARKTLWKPRPLPFIEIVPKHTEKPLSEDELDPNTPLDPTEQNDVSNEINETSIGKIGKYDLKQEIGRGSFATVYLARHTENKQLCAVKSMHLELVSDGELLARFQREADILMQLDDPHIVRIMEHGSDNNSPFIVMEYVDGHSLKWYITSHGQLELLTALNYTRQIAEGLDMAYEHGVVHRNIKPQDILINSKGVVKIADFGLARSRETMTLTQSNVFLGTAYYISPEQAESGHSADIRSDLYSLAAVLFEMLTGQPPYEGDTAVDIVIKHMNDKIPSICRLRPDLRSSADAFMQKALAKSPAERYQTPKEFIMALDLFERDQTLYPGSAELDDPAVSVVNATEAVNDQILLSGQDTPFNLAQSSASKVYNLSKYQLLECIAVGGMGEIWKALDTQLKRYVSIKLLHPAIQQVPDFITRFEQEARIVASLHHPNIVKIYNFHVSYPPESDPPLCYMVMEYVDGGTLRDLRHRLSMSEAVGFVIQAAQGLDYAHSKGIVHRDVKPGNMLLRKDGHLLLCDFGIAKFLEGSATSTIPGSVVGTPKYIPPEQAEGTVDCRSDIYSLGIVLFECLTGHPPFTADTPLAMILQHLHEPLPVKYLRTAGVPEPLEKVLVKMTAKSPADRYQSAQEVIDALRSVSFASPSPIPQTPESSTTPPSKQVPSSSGRPPFMSPLPNARITNAQNIHVTSVQESYCAPDRQEKDTYIGKLIGMYRIVRIIGSGGLGRVYLAQHEILTGRAVAVKLLYKSHDFLKQQGIFFQEARLLDKLKHPSILPIVDVGIDEGLPYVITEYAPNGSLRDRIRGKSLSPLAVRESINILLQVGQALDYTHQQHIIHCDVKPENILFNVKGKALLADFSIAITLEVGYYRASKVEGTPMYMAPEQFEGVISKRSDQYALGCVAYELFTGQPLFPPTDFNSLHFKHTMERPIPPRQHNPSLSSRVERAILKALEKDPANRYPDVKTFLKALR